MAPEFIVRKFLRRQTNTQTVSALYIKIPRQNNIVTYITDSDHFIGMVATAHYKYTLIQKKLVLYGFMKRLPF